MFKLLGFPVSNFYNIVKVSLLEKGLDFEEVPQPPTQDEAFLAKSPLGKIPVLQVREGYLTETAVILDFLEDIYPEIPLYPADPFARAEVRRLCHMAEIYIDAPFRPVVAHVLRGAPLPEERREDVRQALARGADGLARLAVPSPWVHRAGFSAADIFLHYCLGLVAPLAREHLNFDLDKHLPGFDQWREAMAGREFVRQVDAAQQVALAKLIASRKA